MVKILVVEFEDQLCLSIAACLQSLGARVLVTPTVQKATRMIDQGDIDLMILDLELSDGGGLGLLRYVRESSVRAKDLPILVVAAWDTETAFYDYVWPGDYLTKPFDMRTLNLMVRQLLGSLLEEYSMLTQEGEGLGAR